MGFEPTTASLEGWNSTTELRPPPANPQHFDTLHKSFAKDSATAHHLNALSRNPGARSPRDRD